MFGKETKTARPVGRCRGPSRKIGHAPLGIWNAGRPSAPVAGASLGEAPARVARTRQQGIRNKLLRFLDLRSGKHVITGRQKWIGNDFRHQRGSVVKPWHIGSRYVLIKSRSSATPSGSTHPYGLMHQERNAPRSKRGPA